MTDPTIGERLDADTARALAAAYPAVGPDDDLTEELDHWEETRTGATVINLPVGVPHQPGQQEQVNDDPHPHNPEEQEAEQ